MAATIEIKGVDELIKKLGAVAAIKVLERPMQRSLDRIEEYIKKEPGPIPDNLWRLNTSSAQKRAYFAKVKELGGHPKRGEGKLLQSWTQQVIRYPNGLQGKIGNNTEHGPFVQSSEFQARFHRGRWRTDTETINKNRAKIEADFKRAIDRELEK